MYVILMHYAILHPIHMYAFRALSKKRVKAIITLAGDINISNACEVNQDVFLSIRTSRLISFQHNKSIINDRSSYGFLKHFKGSIEFLQEFLSFHAYQAE
ncbi:hypothetical protein CROQUDRAFT_233862 [Cronartium quercuum f. sp. fusiforme G11]|uniref:Uncharacterized protein n=1 Tax=Cronartium quercuum f. sp. fusiforme G11 TaxID=708437 RepID=A0A9P6T8D3_9BASI|nr:hypothetical protein CROQUDRAFT_233862 [Cronartium quercuum f. sp. fusiforme G11]